MNAAKEDLGLLHRIARRLDLGMTRGNADGTPLVLMSPEDARKKALQARATRSQRLRVEVTPHEKRTRKPGRSRQKREAARQRAQVRP